MTRSSSIGIILGLGASLIAFALSTSVNAVDSVRLTNQEAQAAAVGYLEKGFEQCGLAHRLSRINIDESKVVLNAYRDYKAKATALDASVLTASKPIERGVAHCAQVEKDVLRAEALPIIESGIEYCFAAKSALKGKRLKVAKTNILHYQQQKNQALSISNTLVGVSSISSQMRKCDRIASNIDKAQIAYASLLESTKILENSLWQALDTCQNVNGIVEANTQLVNSIFLSAKDHAYINTQQKNVKQSYTLLEIEKKRINAFDPALKIVQQYPERKQSKNIVELMSQLDVCSNNVLAGIGRTQAHLDSAVAIEEIVEPDVEMNVENIETQFISDFRVNDSVADENVIVEQVNEKRARVWVGARSGKRPHKFVAVKTVEIDSQIGSIEIDHIQVEHIQADNTLKESEAVVNGLAKN